MMSFLKIVLGIILTLLGLGGIIAGAFIWIMNAIIGIIVEILSIAMVGYGIGMARNAAKIS
jgi:hypothetical protein